MKGQSRYIRDNTSLIEGIESKGLMRTHLWPRQDYLLFNMSLDSTSLQTARDELKTWDLLASDVAAHQRAVNAWLDRFGPLLQNFNPLQSVTCLPRLALVYAWNAVRSVLPLGFRLSNRQTESLDDVWKHEFATEEAEVDDAFAQFTDEFDAFICSNPDFHLYIASEIETALLGRYTGEMLKKFRHHLDIARDSVVVNGAIADVLADLSCTLKANVTAAFAVGDYWKWERAFRQAVDSPQANATWSQFPNTPTSSIDLSGITATTKADAPSATSTESVETHRPGTSIHVSSDTAVEWLIPRALTVIRTTIAKMKALDV